MGIEDAIMKGGGGATVSDREGLIQSITKGIGEIMSQKDIEQKSHMTETNALGAIELMAANKYFEKHHLFRDRVADAAVLNRVIFNRSIDGVGMKELIQLAQAFGYNVMYVESGAKDILKQLGGSA